MTYVRVQEITLADLFHLPLCSIVFEQFGLGDLDKRPNLQRQGICPIFGNSRLLTCPL